MTTTQSIINKGKKQIEKQESIVKLDNDTFRESLNVVAGTQEGRYVLNRLMDNCGLLRSSVVPNADGLKEEVVHYKEGRRSVWLFELHKYLSVKNLKNILFLDRRKLCQSKKPIKVVKVQNKTTSK